MNGIIIAAGMGKRMRDLTKDIPKCLLKIGSKTLLEWNIEGLKQAGCKEVYIITGYLHKKIEELGYKTIQNLEFETNNVLHSFLKARHLFNQDLIVSYSDIYLEAEIYLELSEYKKDLVFVIDKDWKEYYNKREGVPHSQAEIATLDKKRLVKEIGKNLKIKLSDKSFEFTGLFKISKNACAIIKKSFDEINSKLIKTENFINDTSWEKAYITDFFNYLIKKNKIKADAFIISKGWAEFDSKEDYERLDLIKYSQKLKTLIN